MVRNETSSSEKLTRALRDVDLVDGKLEDMNGNIIYDDCIKKKMYAFKSLARIFIGSSSIQEKLKEQGRFKYPIFCTESEREPMVVNSLTKVSNFLDISAQQRKLVRCTVCSQVTKYRIWRGALEELLNGLKEEVDWLIEHSETTPGRKLGQQVILSCLRFLSESSVSFEAEKSTSWMRPVPGRYAKANASAKWEDVLDMVNDLRRYLEHDEDITVLYHLEKLVSMKEGLLQIKDVFLDNTIVLVSERLDIKSILCRKSLPKRWEILRRVCLLSSCISSTVVCVISKLISVKDFTRRRVSSCA